MCIRDRAGEEHPGNHQFCVQWAVKPPLDRTTACMYVWMPAFRRTSRVLWRGWTWLPKKLVSHRHSHLYTASRARQYSFQSLFSSRNILNQRFNFAFSLTYLDCLYLKHRFYWCLVLLKLTCLVAVCLLVFTRVLIWIWKGFCSECFKRKQNTLKLEMCGKA